MVWINFITLSSYIGMENGMRALDNAIFYGRMERRESNQQRCANHSDLFDRMKVMPIARRRWLGMGTYIIHQMDDVMMDDDGKRPNIKKTKMPKYGKYHCLFVPNTSNKDGILDFFVKILMKQLGLKKFSFSINTSIASNENEWSFQNGQWKMS